MEKVTGLGLYVSGLWLKVTGLGLYVSGLWLKVTGLGLSTDITYG